MSNWLKSALDTMSKAPQAEEPQNSKGYTVHDGVVLMTAEQSAAWVENHGTEHDPELDDLAAAAMDEHMETRAEQFESGTLGEGEHWTKTIEASATPDTSKLNHAHAVKRIAK